MFDIFKKKADGKKLRQAVLMSDSPVSFESFGEDIYASDIIVQAIRCKANEFKKLDPRHVREANGVTSEVRDSSVARMLRRPNSLMTMSELLEKVRILLDLNQNVYLYPTYTQTNGGEKIWKELWPLKPRNVVYLRDASDNFYVELTFDSGYRVTVPREDLIIYRKDYGVRDFFGGNAFGGNDRRGLLKMLKRYEQITQGIAKAMEVSCSVTGVLEFQGYYSGEKLDVQIEDFQKRLKNNEIGMLPTDLNAKYTPISRDVKIADAETTRFFYDAILMNTGVSLPILRGDYTKTQKEAFYESALEADIKGLGEAISKTLFTEREESFGNSVVLYPHKINFMSMENKIAAMNVTVPAGIFKKDEVREILGYPPLPDGQGQVIAQGYNLLLDENNQNTQKKGDE